MDVSEMIAVAAVALVWVILVITIAQALRSGWCGVGGWGTAQRATEPIRYWIFVAFHVGLWLVLGWMLVMEAIDVFGGAGGGL